MKLKIKIFGSKVHGVGYRPWLTNAAMDAGLQGFNARNNMENKNPVVIVLAEGEEENISHFEEMVRGGKPQYAEVDRIDAGDYTGSVMPLDKYAMIIICMQMNKAIPLLLGMNNKMDGMLAGQDKMLAGQDKMLAGQDKMLAGQNRMLVIQEKMLEKEDETIEEIRDLRDDLVMHSNTDRLIRMEKDIRVIKSKMAIR